MLNGSELMHSVLKLAFPFFFSFSDEASADSEHQTAGPEVIYDDVPCEDLSSGEGQS